MSNQRKRTADYPSPPEKSIVGTLNNPGVRYYVKRITSAGVVVVQWVAINADPFLIAVAPDTTYGLEEWGRLMDRWILVHPPWKKSRLQPYREVSIADFYTNMGIVLQEFTPYEDVTMIRRTLVQWVQSPHGIPCDGATRPGGEREVPDQAPQGDA